MKTEYYTGFIHGMKAAAWIVSNVMAAGKQSKGYQAINKRLVSDGLIYLKWKRKGYLK